MAEWTRRTMLASSLAASMLAGETGAQSAMPRPAGERREISGIGRIDTHQHLLPPEFIAALDRHGMSEWHPFPWSVDGALAMMDRHRIATGVLSLSTPGPNIGTAAEARILARQVNERQAALVQQRPDRFGMFASVPLLDVDGALEAIAYAYDQLHTDGVILLANCRGVYLGDPSFEPIMAELNRRAAVVFIHPGPVPGAPIVQNSNPSFVDFLLDTTRAAVNLVTNGIPRRYPRLRIILSHAGGFVPYAAYRIAALSHFVHSELDRAAMLEDLSNFYFDTALSSSPSALPSLLEFAKPGHVLFGSDFPYCGDEVIGFFADGLDAYQGLDLAGHAAIDRHNAERLIPRLTARSSARSPGSAAALAMA